MSIEICKLFKVIRNSSNLVRRTLNVMIRAERPTQSWYSRDMLFHHKVYQVYGVDDFSCLTGYINLDVSNRESLRFCVATSFHILPRYLQS